MKKIIAVMIIMLLIPVNVHAGTLNARDGVNQYQGRKETYYNLPMRRVVDRANANGLGGWYWEREDGVKMYGYFVIVAADFKKYPLGTIIETSLGYGMVLDTGEFATKNSDMVDIAVNW